MILADFECKKGHVNEHLVHSDCNTRKCPVCGGRAKKIISQSGQYLGNVDAQWIKTVLSVVDKSNPAPHVQEFIRNPNRGTYQHWMKKEGIRPMDRAEPIRPKINYEALKQKRDREIMDKLIKRNRIEL